MGTTWPKNSQLTSCSQCVGLCFPNFYMPSGEARHQPAPGGWHPSKMIDVPVLKWPPTPVLLSGKSQGRWTAVHGVSGSPTRLSDFTFIFTSIGPALWEAQQDALTLAPSSLAVHTFHTSLNSLHTLLFPPYLNAQRGFPFQVKTLVTWPSCLRLPCATSLLLRPWS